MNDQELEAARIASLKQAQKILSQMEPKTVVEIAGDGTYAFHMNFVQTTPFQHPELEIPTKCGTVGCILGLANLLERTAGRETWVDWDNDSETTDPYYRLFYPGSGNLAIDYDMVTPKQAARAIGQFLNGDEDLDFITEV